MKQVRFAVEIIAPKISVDDINIVVGVFTSDVHGIQNYLNNGLGFDFTKAHLYRMPSVSDGKRGSEYLISGDAINSACTDWHYRHHIQKRKDLGLPFHARVSRLN